jgi:hypothetical protein
LPNGSISACSRRGKIYVAPNDGAVEIDPVFVTDLDLDQFVVAFERALAAIPPEPSTWLSLRDYKSPIQRAAGVERNAEFERGLKMVTVKIDESGYLIEPWKPLVREGRGFTIDDSALVALSLDTPLRSVAEHVMKVFLDPRWPVR